MLDLPPSFDALNLKKPDSDGVPKQRLSDPSKASAMVMNLIQANSERSQIDSHVKGMLDGNAPFSHCDLKAKGQGQRTNVNFREGEAMLGDAMTPFYDLFAESDTYCKIEVDEENSQKRAEWSRKVTAEFDALVKEWAGFDWNMQSILHDMVAYGKGFAMWPDKTSWQFKSVRQSRVLVPDQTPSDPDQLELLVVRQACTVSELYKPIRDKDRAKSIGWNVSAVMDACRRSMPESTSATPLDWEQVQQELRNHDLYHGTKSDVINIAHIFVKEFNNKVSHLIIEEVNGRTESGIGEDKEGGRFLYKKIGRFESFRQVVSPLFYDIGDGTWHSIKGLAIKLYPFIEIKNRLNCSVVDNAFINMSVLVRPTTAQAMQNAAIMHLGPLSILPPNVEIQQWGLTGRMEEGLAVENALTRKLESNLGQYRKAPEQKHGNPDTATKVTYDAAKEASLGKGAVNRFYVQLDMLFEQIFKRACNPNLVSDNKGQNDLATDFQKRCIDAGVPKVKLLKPRFIRATRNIGNGSIFLRQQTVLQTAQFVPMLNEAGRQAWLDDAIAVMAGTESVARWNPKMTASPEIQNQAAEAQQGIALMKVGIEPMATPTQNAVVVATVYLGAAAQALQSITQGGNPMEVYGFLQIALSAIGKQLQRVSQDPTRQQAFKALEEQFMELGKQMVQLQQFIQKQQQQAQRQQMQMKQRQQEVMTNGRLDQFELDNKLRMQQEKTDAMIRLKEEKQRQSLQLSDASTASNISLKAQQAEADTAIKAQRAKTTKE